RSQVSVPELLAVEVVSDDARRGKVGVDRGAVSYGRGGTGGILAVGGLFHQTGDFLLPEVLSVGAAQGDHRPTLAAVERLGEEDAVAPDDGGRVPRSRQGDFPADVLGGAPAGRQVSLVAHPGPVWPAPGRPVVGPGRADQEEEANQEDLGLVHGA